MTPTIPTSFFNETIGYTQANEKLNLVYVRDVLTLPSLGNHRLIPTFS